MRAEKKCLSVEACFKSVTDLLTPHSYLCRDARRRDIDVPTVFCLIEAPGAIARLNLIPWSKSWGPELSNGGFGLKIGQILRELNLF